VSGEIPVEGPVGEQDRRLPPVPPPAVRRPPPSESRGPRTGAPLPPPPYPVVPDSASDRNGAVRQGAPAAYGPPSRPLLPVPPSAV
jgi:putative peptidoglycan lipid II flippase